MTRPGTSANLCNPFYCMHIIFQVILGICPFTVLFCLYMLYRNNKVFTYRMFVLEKSDPDIGKRLRNFDKLPDYTRMICQLLTFNWDSYWK